MEATITQCRVTRFVDAPLAQVFEAWTDPAIMASWISPNPEYYPHTTVDLRVGGNYRIEMRHQAGMTHVVGGTYRVVEPPKVLEFTWAWIGGPMEGADSVVRVEFSPSDGGTEVVLTHEFTGEGAEAAASEHEKGWNGCVDRLENVYGRTESRHLGVLFGLHRRLFENALDGISENDLTVRITSNTNHLLWLAGHQACTRSFVAQLLGDTTVDGESLGIFNKALDENADYPGMNEIMDIFNKASGAIMGRLPHVTTEALNAPAPFEHPGNDATVGGLVDFLLDHEGYHIGQMGFLRKALGYDALSYDVRPAAFHGRFLWYELRTPDPEGAKAFYSNVIGWGTQAWSAPGADEMPPYTMWMAGDAPIGGMAEMPLEGAQWIAYIGTTDVDASVDYFVENGGALLQEATSVPSVGRMALVSDPSGAAIGLYTPEGPMPLSEGDRPGLFSWHELATINAEKVASFYMKHFNWKTAGDTDMGEMGTYAMFSRTEVPHGGIYNKPAEAPGGPSWLYYVMVEDLDGALERVKQSGGQVLVGPIEVPGGDMIAQCVDPSGIPFALHAASNA